MMKISAFKRQGLAVFEAEEVEKCRGFLNRKLNFSTKIRSQIWQNVDLNEQYPPLLKISAIVNNAAGNFKSVLTKIF